VSSEVAVVILAGGEGSRIGGGKPLKELAGKRLIDRAIELARGWSDSVAVAVRGASQLGQLDAKMIEDYPVEGPLGGLLSALQFARVSGRPLLFAIPADMPFLPPDLLQRLVENIGDSNCAMAASGGRSHPVCSLWRVQESIDRAESYVATGRRSLHGFAEFVTCVAVDWPGGFEDPFFNINSQADLAAAERRIS
jgi:molybdopterin-guanine dinucleotide biosynthesis protein A